MSIKTWWDREQATGQSTHSAMQEEIADLRTALAERDAELTKAQDELNCTEVELEVASCNLHGDEFNQGFECMGDFVRAVSEGYKTQLAERENGLSSWKSIFNEAQIENDALKAELANLCAAAQQALEQFKKITWARPVSKEPSKLVEQLETMALMGAAALTAALESKT